MSRCETRLLQRHFIFMSDGQIMQSSPCLFEFQMGEKLEPLIHSHDVNGEMFSHKPLKCSVVCGHRPKQR